MKHTCKHCQQSDELLDPYEMDGVVDGVYYARGLWWVFCRRCASHTRVEAPE